MKRPIPLLTQPGWVTLISIGILMTIGIASIYVTDTHYARGHDGPINAAKQCLHAVIGCAFAFVVLKVGYQHVARFSYVIFLFAIVALIPLLLAKTFHTDFGGLTSPRNGAYRWIQLPGFQLQPSEVMKLAYVLALAWYLRYRKNYRRFSGLMLPFVLSVVPLTLILLEPDLGTVLLLIPVLFSMLFVAGAKLKHLAIIVLIGIAFIPIAWGQIKGYQRARVTAVLLQSKQLRKAIIDHPENYRYLTTKRQALEWAASSGYQLVHSKNAIGSGGLFGQGWGEGVYVNHTLLPDRHNDFVFSVVAHQWGLMGCLLVLGCYTAIVLAGVQIASATTDPFGRLLSVGVVTLLAMQVLINVGMACGLMPITGMTLPFVSYGGSSLLSSFISMALLVSVSQHRPYLLATRPYEFTSQQQEQLHMTLRDV